MLQCGAVKQDVGSKADLNILVADLKACSRTRNLERGKQLHAQLSHLAHDSSIYAASALINMYAKCGCMEDAHQVFDRMKQKDFVSWTALISGYADNGQCFTALELFTRMSREGFTPDSITFLAALRACRSLAAKGANGRAECRGRGKALHNLALENGCIAHIYVQNTLIDMYSRCGSIVDAHQVFDSMKQRNVVSWNVLIMGCAELGQGLELFSRMKNEGPPPDSVTILAVLKACTALASEGPSRWEECRGWCNELENLAKHSDCNSNIYVLNSLIDMYAKCGSIVDARRVFDSMKEPDVVSWNVLILRYAENGQGVTALDLFRKMRRRSTPNSVTFVATLKACTSVTLQEESRIWGMVLHNLVLDHCCSSNIYVQNSLIDMYSKTGNMTAAQEVFNGMENPDTVPWNAIILGNAENGQGLAALGLFVKMQTRGLAPDYATFVAAIKACSSLAVNGGGRDRCKLLHNIAIERNCSSDVCVESTLIEAYGKCGSMADSRQVFNSMKHPDVISWTSLIVGYAENGEFATAIGLFARMESSGCAPDYVAFVAAVKSCTFLASAGKWIECRNRGRAIHILAVEKGFASDIYLQNALIDMYATCRSMVDARQVFDGMKDPDVVSWNALIMGYAGNGHGATTLELFMRMPGKPDVVACVGALKACALVGALELGRKIHSELANVDLVLVNCLVDFYTKCGSMVEAQRVFDLHADTRDLITWNSLLAGYSSSGDNESVLALFEAMQDSGFHPDGVTLLCVLASCSHAGLTDKGKAYFDAMCTRYRLLPSAQHYSCMVDMFGRAKQLNEAVALLHRMPCTPDSITWMSLLGACHKWKNVEIGNLAFQSLIQLGHSDSAAYVLMEQIFESRGMLQEQQMVMQMRTTLTACH